METDNYELEIWEQIDQYIDDTLSAEQRQAFEQMIAKNEELAEMVAFSRGLRLKEQYRGLSSSLSDLDTRDRLRRQAEADPDVYRALQFDQSLYLSAYQPELRALLKTFKQPAPVTPPGTSTLLPFVKWAGSVFAIFLLAGVLWYLLQPERSPQFLPEVNNYAIRASGFPEELAQAYDEGNYQVVMKELESLRKEIQASGPPSKEETDFINFYIAVCEMRLGDLEKAASIFRDLSVREADIYGLPQELYLGLILLEQGKEQEARYWLERAADNPGYLEDQQAIGELARKYLMLLSDS